MAFFKIDGGRIYFEARGEGSPILFVHGLACAHEDWERQVEHFAATHRVITLDQRGHGRSTGFTGGFDIPTLGADLAALVAHAGLEHPLLVGHSMGCRVVLECARVAPDAVAGLVLIDGSLLATEDPEAARRAAREAIREAGYDAFFERLFTQMFIPTSDPRIRDAIVARARRLPVEVGSELMPAMVAWDGEHAARALGDVKVPMTVLQSMYLNDRRERVPIEPGQTTPWMALARSMAPHAVVEAVPGSGHFAMIEAPDAVNGHIARTLEKI